MAEESEGENWEGEFGWGLGPFLSLSPQPPVRPRQAGKDGQPSPDADVVHWSTLSPRRSSQTLASLGCPCPPSHAAQGEGQEADCRRYDEGHEAASNLNRERNRALT